MKILITSGIIILLFAVSSCYYDSKEYLYPQLNSCDTSNITYATCVTSVLENNCLGCHSGSASSGGGIKLDSYPEVKIRVDNGKLMGSINQLSGFSPMPKSASKLSSDDIAIIEKWITQAALDN